MIIKTGKKTIIKGEKREMERASNAVSSNFGNIDSLLARRHQITKKIFSKAKAKYDRDQYQRMLKPKISIGRNAPCHCGSGKKFKRCCMRK